MKRLVFDLETAPNLAHVWGLYNQNISISQLREASRVICWAAKWVDKPGVLFASDHHDGHETMVAKAWELFDQADSLVTWNGASFDTKHMNREFLLAGAPPPSPLQQIDLLRTARKQFRFSSNKLDFVSQQLGVGSKVKHEGHDLWVKCLAGDDAAWGRMRRYCKADVVLTEKLYHRLGAWKVAHPNFNLFGADGCPQCGSQNVQRRGIYRTAVTVYHRVRCTDCGGWSREKHADVSADLRAVQ